MPDLLDPALLVQVVPSEWWPLIGVWSARAVAALVVAHAVLAALYKLDALDGREDYPKLSKAYFASLWMAEHVVALLEMLPFRLPVVGGLKRLRDIHRESHPDDARLKP